jgi:hypothetical protein
MRSGNIALACLVNESSENRGPPFLVEALLEDILRGKQRNQKSDHGLYAPEAGEIVQDELSGISSDEHPLPVASNESKLLILMAAFCLRMRESAIHNPEVRSAFPQPIWPPVVVNSIVLPRFQGKRNTDGLRQPPLRG